MSLRCVKSLKAAILTTALKFKSDLDKFVCMSFWSRWQIDCGPLSHITEHSNIAILRGAKFLLDQSIVIEVGSPLLCRQAALRGSVRPVPLLPAFGRVERPLAVISTSS